MEDEARHIVDALRSSMSSQGQSSSGTVTMISMKVENEQDVTFGTKIDDEEESILEGLLEVNEVSKDTFGIKTHAPSSETAVEIGVESLRLSHPCIRSKSDGESIEDLENASLDDVEGEELVHRPTRSKPCLAIHSVDDEENDDTGDENKDSKEPATNRDMLYKHSKASRQTYQFQQKLWILMISLKRCKLVR